MPLRDQVNVMQEVDLKDQYPLKLAETGASLLMIVILVVRHFRVRVILAILRAITAIQGPRVVHTATREERDISF